MLITKFNYLLPMPPCPDWEAPPAYPIWRFNSPSWARNWASVNVLSFFSAILGPNVGPLYSGCFWVYFSTNHLLSNQKQKQKRNKLSAWINFKSHWSTTYQTTQCIQTQSNLRDVSPFKQISSLEDFFFGQSIFLDSCLEALNIFHQLEVGTTLLDFFHTSRCQFIGQFT